MYIYFRDDIVVKQGRVHNEYTERNIIPGMGIYNNFLKNFKTLS